jgi:2,3-bisphosphoglycerate-dependent phosphoglycerate mutase
MPEVLLVRHAAALGQASDAPLSSEGEKQAEELADLLEQHHVERVICSPFLRAIQSIAPYCQRKRLEVEIEPRLVERVLSKHDVPDWRSELRRSFDDLDYCLESGESSRVAQKRAVVVLNEAIASEQPCALITHGNLLALLLNFMLPSVGYEDWGGLSTPDVFSVQTDERGKSTFKRIWHAEGASASAL